ncbi:hypothetical protein BC830DRAFT_1168316 [Chytriomyces sp. MP71]|nr:hypothetical protein BC830DRAFT_1168316 [Chytriomyces sp. MP71]
MAHVLRNRPHLLKEQHIAEKTAFLGVFNTSKSARLHFVLDNTAEVKPLPGDLLLHWQADLLLKRYWQEAFDKKLPLGERVMAASRLVNMANVSVNEIASFLVEDSLPSRVKEGVLMFLPLIDEPAAAIDLLTAPVFLQSDLARTAIYAVKNVLPYMEKDVLVEITAIYQKFLQCLRNSGIGTIFTLMFAFLCYRNL